MSHYVQFIKQTLAEVLWTPWVDEDFDADNRKEPSSEELDHVRNSGRPRQLTR